MDIMMNKQQVIVAYKELTVALDELPSQVILSGGSALVIMGLREETNDLDVDVTDNVFKWTLQNHPLVIEPERTPFIRYNPLINLFELEENTGVVWYNGVWLYSPNELLKQRRMLISNPSCHPAKREKYQAEAIALQTLIKSPGRLSAKVM